MNKKTLAAIVVCATFLLTTTAILADQDVIILDPGNGTWYEDGGIMVPGASSVYRDDLFTMPPGKERIICFMKDGSAIAASKIRYVIRRGPADVDLVEVIDKSGPTSGVKIRWNGYKAERTCDHLDADSCEFSGIAPEVFGPVVGGQIEAKVGTKWVLVEGMVQLQETASGAPACTGF